MWRQKVPQATKKHQTSSLYCSYQSIAFTLYQHKGLALCSLSLSISLSLSPSLTIFLPGSFSLSLISFSSSNFQWPLRPSSSEERRLDLHQTPTKTEGTNYRDGNSSSTQLATEEGCSRRERLTGSRYCDNPSAEDATSAHRVQNTSFQEPAWVEISPTNIDFKTCFQFCAFLMSTSESRRTDQIDFFYAV